MLDQATRTAILKLHEKGCGTRKIARTLGISRGAVRDVIDSKSAEVPRIIKSQKAEVHRQEILELYTDCGGNLVRVHEELQALGAELSYQALTAFCRRAEIGHEPKRPAGQYHFEPGEEMQHDTSPHTAKIQGKERSVQTASLVLCFSRMLFFQHYPSFNRFALKLFFSDALGYFERVAGRCMIDNTSIVVLHGTGKNMVPVPELAAFGERYGFTWAAHEVGDADRKGRVERPFSYIEGNFLAGRDFKDFADLNAQARAWCDRKNATFKRTIHAVPRELFASERTALKPLPAWVPEVYELHQRIVDVEGYVAVRRHRYSAPWRLIGRRVEVRESKDKIELYDGPRLVAAHRRVFDDIPQRITEPSHRPPRGVLSSRQPAPEEQALLKLCPEIEPYVAALKKRVAGRGTLALRKLWRMASEYPREPFVSAVLNAQHFGLYDLERLERMVLRSIAKDFFIPPPMNFDPPPGEQNEDRDDE